MRTFGASAGRAGGARSPAAAAFPPQAAAGPGGGGEARTGSVRSLPLPSPCATLFKSRSCRAKRFCCIVEQHREIF